MRSVRRPRLSAFQLYQTANLGGCDSSECLSIVGLNNTLILRSTLIPFSTCYLTSHSRPLLCVDIHSNQERVNLKLFSALPTLNSTVQHSILIASKTERRAGKLIRITHPRNIVSSTPLLLPVHHKVI